MVSSTQSEKSRFGNAGRTVQVRHRGPELLGRALEQPLFRNFRPFSLLAVGSAGPVRGGKILHPFAKDRNVNSGGAGHFVHRRGRPAVYKVYKGGVNSEISNFPMLLRSSVWLQYKGSWCISVLKCSCPSYAGTEKPKRMQ